MHIILDVSDIVDSDGHSVKQYVGPQSYKRDEYRENNSRLRRALHFTAFVLSLLLLNSS